MSDSKPKVVGSGPISQLGNLCDYTIEKRLFPYAYDYYTLAVSKGGVEIAPAKYGMTNSDLVVEVDKAFAYCKYKHEYSEKHPDAREVSPPLGPNPGKPKQK